LPQRCRYFVTDPQGLKAAELLEAMEAEGPSLQFRAVPEARPPSWTVSRRGEAVADLEVFGHDDARFKGELDEYLAALKGSDLKGREEIAQRVSEVECLVAVETHQDGGGYGTQGDPLRPLWDWLLDHRTGVLDVDERGFAEGIGVIPEDEE
jgi:hypothetical protein